MRLDPFNLSLLGNRPIGLHSRRRFAQYLSFGAAMLTTSGACAEELTKTPGMTEGPFYPDKLPLDTDNETRLMNDSNRRTASEAPQLSVCRMRDQLAKRFPLQLGVILLALCSLPARADEVLAERAAQAMKRATAYFRSEVALNGGYVYFYSPDLKRRFGEGEALGQVVWVQPPGTPTVGLALLRAFDATGDELYLQAAREAGQALIYGQLQSGGWTNCIDFDPRGSRTALYRNGRGRGKNNSSLDDGQTQSALQFLIRLDQAEDFGNAAVHAAVAFGLESLLAAQYPVGAFPQVWDGPVQKPVQQVVAGNYPTYDWRTENRIKEYWTLYTLNDNTAVYLFETLSAAFEVYQDPKYQQAIRSLGDFLILAQMPAPQAGWAQQYNFDMQPAWARRFEPPAVSGHESQAVVRLLMDIYRQTGDAKYLQPVQPALDYLRTSQLSDGRIARYYQLQSNKPLYMERRGDVYTLTYSDANLPTHYSWKTDSQVDALQQQFDRMRWASDDALPSVPDGELAAQVERILEDQDALGRWLSRGDGSRLIGQNRFTDGQRYLSTAVFCENLTLLADFVERSRGR